MKKKHSSIALNIPFLQVFLVNYAISNIKHILDSLQQQTYKNFNVIVVDNNKKDLSFDLCKMCCRRNTINITCIKNNNALSINDLIVLCMQNSYNCMYYTVIDCSTFKFTDNDIFKNIYKYINKQINNIDEAIIFDTTKNIFKYGNSNIEGINNNTLVISKDVSIFRDIFNDKARIIENKPKDKIEEKTEKNIIQTDVVEQADIKQTAIIEKTEIIEQHHIDKNNVIDTVEHETVEDKLLITILIANYNNDKYLKRSIDSALALSYDNCEIIIIDDGSTDKSLKILSEYKKKYSNISYFLHSDKQHHGLAETIKLGIQNSNGTYIALCESGDILDKDNISEKVKVILNEKLLAFIVNDINVITTDDIDNQQIIDQVRSKSKAFKDGYNNINEDLIIKDNPIITLSECMIKKDILLKCTLNSLLNQIIDLWLYLQILNYDKRIYFINKKLISWRILQDNEFVEYKNKIVSQMKNNVLLKNSIQMNKHVVKKSSKSNENLIKFSIIMPTHNRKNCINVAIDSVISLQYSYYELIIVDDGSTDDTDKYLAEKYKKQISDGFIKYFKIEKSGVSAARNFGLSKATNEWICYLDSDDYFNNKYLSTVAFNINKYAPYYNCYILQTELTKCLKDEFDYERLVWLNYIQMESFIHHIDLYKKYGGFDESFKALVDWDLELKYTKNANCKYIKTENKLFTVCKSNSANRITTNISNKNKFFNTIRLRYAKELYPTISVIVASYNNAQYLRQALNSVLEQVGKFILEVVIADDGSTDESHLIIEEYKQEYGNDIIVDVSTYSNFGIAKNMLHAIDAASGKYIAILESDDYWTDKFKLRKQLEFLDANPDCKLVFSKLKILNAADNSVSYLPIQDKFNKILSEYDIVSNPHQNCIFNLSTLLCDATILKNIDRTLFGTIFSEIPLSLYVLKYGKIGYINIPLSIYRRHESFWSGKTTIEKLKYSINIREIAMKLCSDANKHFIQDIIDKKEKELIRLTKKQLTH